MAPAESTTVAGNDVAFIGVDVGAAFTKVSSKSGQILRNELGGVTTSTMLGFPARSWRLIGESAVATYAANARNTVVHLPRLLGRPHAQVTADDAHILRYHMFPLTTPADPGAEEASVSVQEEGAEGGERTYSPTELAAMLVGKVKTYELVEGEDAARRQFAFAVPKAYPEAHAQALLDAAAVAGLAPGDVLVTTATDALLATYRQKHPVGEFGDGERKRVLLVDVGYAQTSVVAFEMGAEGFPTVLAEAYDAGLGASNFDDKLFAHFAGEIAKKYGAEEGAVQPGSKKALRLLAGVEKAKKLLSTIPVAQTQVENVVEGRDIDLQLTREAFTGLVESEVARFRALIAKVLTEAGVGGDGLAAVEITGGAMRMPCLQEAVVAETKFGKPLGLKLDDNAVAYGAALLLAGGPVGAPVPPNDASAENGRAGPSLLLRGEAGGRLGAEKVAALAVAEAARVARDEELHALAEVKNAMESFVLELRGMAGSKHGKLVDGAKVAAFAEELDNWLWSEEADGASLADARAKLEAARAEAGALCQAYYNAVAEEKAAYEQSLEEEAKKAEAEREAEGEDGDHDNRKLKKADRMRLVLKNKEEGNELFGGGNFKPAAARYVKALTHASKFFDLAPDDEEEVRKIKVGLYSNVALCYFKMSNLDATIRNCDEALKLDADNTKVLYRRAAAYEAKKNFEAAEQDLKQALKLAPEDKAINALSVRVAAQIKREKDKEKAMWSKAFS